MNFANKFKEKGKWWIPGNDNDKCFGELSYDPQSGLVLTFFGSLLGSKNIFRSQNNVSIKIIIGITQGGKCITLIDTFGHETGSDKLLESTFDVSYACISSTHFLTPETDQFDIISFNLNCSEAFFSRLYKTIEQEDFSTESPKKFKYEQTDPIKVYEDYTIKSSLFFSYSFKHSWTNKDEFAFSQRVFLNSNLTSFLNFETSVSLAKNIKGMFSFFSTYIIYFNHLSIREKQSNEFFEILFSENRKGDDRLSRGDMLICCDELAGDFEELFKWWIVNQEFTANGLSLYLQLLNYRIGSFPQMFLSIVFALETLHSSLLDKKPFTEEQYAKFKQQKKQFTIDDMFKKRFNDCMSHFNSMSFANRLQDLISIGEDILREYIYDTNDFIQKVTSQRNYFAHNHSEPNESLIEVKYYDYYVDVCKLIFEINFLKICGVNEKNIRLILKRHFFHKYFKSKMPDIVVGSSTTTKS
jgi:hypothetical protein